MEGVAQDLRQAMRSLARSRGFSAVAILMLGLGIGANASVFAVTHAVLLKPLPFVEPDRLVRLWSNQVERGLTFFSVSAADFSDWRRESRVFERMAAYDRHRNAVLSGDARQAENVVVARASAELFPLLGVGALLGRTFTEQETTGRGARVAVVTHGFWRSALGGTADVIGSEVTLDQEPYTVVGVLSPDFMVPGNPAAVWTPLSLTGETDRSDRFLRVIGRMKPRYRVDDARRDLEALTARLALSYPATNAGWSISVQSLEEVVVGVNFQRALMVLLFVVGGVLLIACANVGNLLLIRSVARRKELTIRLALGATRRRLIRSWSAETALLGLAGGVVGLILGSWSVDLLSALGAADIPRLEEVRMSGTVAAFTLALSLLAGVLLTAIPAAHTTFSPSFSGVAREGRGSTGPRFAGRTRSFLVVVQVSLAVLLLVSANLLLHSLRRVGAVELGFVPDDVLVAPIALPSGSYDNDDAVLSFYQELVARARSLPGVRLAAAVSSAPMAGPNSATRVLVEDDEFVAGGAIADTDYRASTPGYFATLGIPLRRGRDFTEADRTGPHVIVVSDAFVRQHFRDDDPLGKRMRFGDVANGPWRTVVGVVADVRYQSVETPSVRPMVYLPHRGSPDMMLVLRGTGEAVTLAAGIRRELAALDPNLAPGAVSQATDLLDDLFAQRRFQLVLFGAFASIALLLCTVGIYGVSGYAVSQRTRELGVRAALGARAGQLVTLIVRQGLVLAGLGAAVGAAGALALTGVIRRLLFDTSTRDPFVYASVIVLLMLVAGVASYLPARRATRIDPRTALQDVS